MFVSNGRKKGVGKRRSLCAFQSQRPLRPTLACLVTNATQAHGTAQRSSVGKWRPGE